MSTTVKNKRVNKNGYIPAKVPAPPFTGGRGDTMDRIEHISSVSRLKAEILMDMMVEQPTYASEIAERIDRRRQVVISAMENMDEYGWISQQQKIANANIYGLTDVGNDLALCIQNFCTE